MRFFSNVSNDFIIIKSFIDGVVTNHNFFMIHVGEVLSKSSILFLPEKEN